MTKPKYERGRFGGFDTRIAQITYLRSIGLTERQISEETGLATSTITAFETRARQRETVLSQRVMLSSMVKADLEREAFRRGHKDVDQFVNEVLRIVVVDNLFKALLGD